MAAPSSYEYEEGTPVEIINFDREEIESAIGTVDFELGIQASTYEPEELIYDYINRLFEKFNSIKDNQWVSAQETLRGYVNVAEEVPEPNPVEGAEDFQEEEEGGQLEEPTTISGVVKTQGGNLNVRSGPGTNSEVVGSLKPGTEVSVVGYDESGEWAKINIDGQEYYVSKNYLESSNESGGQSQITNGVVKTQGGSLNVRSGPGTNSEVVGSLKPGTEVNVIGYDESGKWAKIEMGGKEYYVSSDYIKTTE